MSSLLRQQDLSAGDVPASRGFGVARDVELLNLGFKLGPLKGAAKKAYDDWLTERDTSDGQFIEDLMTGVIRITSRHRLLESYLSRRTREIKLPWFYRRRKADMFLGIAPWWVLPRIAMSYHRLNRLRGICAGDITLSEYDVAGFIRRTPLDAILRARLEKIAGLNDPEPALSLEDALAQPKRWDEPAYFTVIVTAAHDGSLAAMCARGEADAQLLIAHAFLHEDDTGNLVPIVPAPLTTRRVTTRQDTTAEFERITAQLRDTPAGATK